MFWKTYFKKQNIFLFPDFYLFDQTAESCSFSSDSWQERELNKFL